MTAAIIDLAERRQAQHAKLERLEQYLRELVLVLRMSNFSAEQKVAVALCASERVLASEFPR